MHIRNENQNEQTKKENQGPTSQMKIDTKILNKSLTHWIEPVGFIPEIKISFSLNN